MAKDPNWNDIRLEVFQSEYWPTQSKPHPRLLIVLWRASSTTIRLYRLKNTRPTGPDDFDVIRDMEFDIAQVRDIQVGIKARHWVRRGYSIMFFKPGPAEDEEAIEQLVAQHFEEYQNQFNAGELKLADGQWRY